MVNVKVVNEGIFDLDGGGGGWSKLWFRKDSRTLAGANYF